MKLKPGLKMEMQPRWVQVSSHGLRYYKNRWTKNSALLKPLGAIPIEAIARIQILGSDVTSIHTSCSKKEHFTFEIVLKHDYLSLYLDPMYDLLQVGLGTEIEHLSAAFRRSEIAEQHPIKKDHIINRYLQVTSMISSSEQTTTRHSYKKTPRDNIQEQESLIIGETRDRQLVFTAQNNLNRNASAR